MQNVPGLLHVGVHLLDQRFQARILHLATQPCIEVDGDLDSVELQIVAIEDLRLDPPLDPVEGRIGTD